MYTQIYAHRGASFHAPENTMEAFQTAEQMGADGIELDAHLSKDGRVVVIHDDTVERTSNGMGKVHDLMYSELRALDVSEGKPGFFNSRIPLLDEVYEWMQQNNLQINVELKENAYENGFLIIPKVLELEKQYHMNGRVVYSSFNHYALRELKQCCPTSRTAILYAAALVDVWKYAQEVPSEAIHPHYMTVQNRELVLQCHAHGVQVRPWTVDAQDELKKLLDLGVDAVITNRPDLALKSREGCQNRSPESQTF